MKKTLLGIAVLFALVHGAFADGIVAYRGKINYKVFTGVERLNGRVDVILLRDATDLDGNEYYLLIDKKQKLVWIFTAGYQINIWQANDGTNVLDLISFFPDIEIEVNGNNTILGFAVGGYAKQKPVDTYYVPPPAAVTKGTVVDAFKSMPIKGLMLSDATVAPAADSDDEYHTGRGWGTGSFRYNKKLTKDLNTDSEILGVLDAAWQALRGELEDDGYESEVVVH